MRQEYRTRAGNEARRAKEFAVIVDQVKRRKEAFIKRLEANIVSVGDCLCYTGRKDHNGYPRLNFKYQGEHITITAARVFLILKLCGPIPLEHEAGHTEECQHRSCVKHLRLEHYTSNAATQHSHRRGQ